MTLTILHTKDARLNIEYMHFDKFNLPPSGEQFSEQRDNWSTPYKFNDYGGESFNKAFDEHTARSAELDAETGLYYYGARYYTPEIGIWLSVDPMSDKYPHQSNYMYCSGRLVNVIDPDGMDEWEVNVGGNVVNRIQNDKKDAFHIVDDKGKRIDGKSVGFEKGTVLGRVNYNKKYGKENKNIDIYAVNNSNDGEKLHQFFTENTNVEFARFDIKQGDNEINIIGTSHDAGADYSSPDIKNYLTKNGGLGSLLNFDHNHPNDYAMPSGFGKNDKNGDKFFIESIEKVNSNTNFRINTKSKPNEYQYYNNLGPILKPATVIQKK
ncbi:MAG: JAB-like toxin 1 domain-containing protein [Bacteroidales bacterium]|nr:JAB-like toxin 1 domain-containing protein [Bacteroidales bacterium]